MRSIPFGISCKPFFIKGLGEGIISARGLHILVLNEVEIASLPRHGRVKLAMTGERERV